MRRRCPAVVLRLVALTVSTCPLAPFCAGQSTVSVTVANALDTSSGIGGTFQTFLSTSFQPKEGDDQFFVTFPGATAPLTALEPRHIRIQAISEDVPETTAGTWDFSRLNGMMVPIQSAADHSPEFQIAVAPSYLDGSSGQMLQTSANVQAYAQYAANLVQYYNTGGFDVNGRHFQSPSPYPIEYWGIFNEPNGNGLTAQQYVDLYDATVPAMQAADPQAKYVALELSDYGTQVDDYLPTFVSQVSAHVDVVATHFYSTCNQVTSDEEIFQSVPGFGADVRKIYGYLAGNPALANVPVWVTENNINSDYDIGNGISACNGTPFTSDPRGTSAFFAAWRPWVFAELSKAGAQALYQWDFSDGAQAGEVDSSSDQTYLSYWVDYYLARFFPTPPGGQFLQIETSVSAVQSVAVRYPDNSVSILLANPTVSNPNDNNGPGSPVTVTLDVSALGSNWSSISEVLLDAETNIATGPTVATLPVTPQIQIPFSGYGAAFLHLVPVPVNLTAAGIVNAAGYQSGAVAPGEILTLFGTGLGPATFANGTQSYPSVQDNFAAGMRVFFGGVPAPVVYTWDRQVSVIVPYEVTGQSSTTAQLEYMGQLSAPIPLQVTAAAPGIFSMNASGTGQGAILNQDFSVNSASNPASPGDIVQIFATGEGDPEGTYVTGLFPTSSPWDTNVSAVIGGVPAEVSYAGAAPYEVGGVMQVNVRIPAGTASGANVPVQVSAGNAISQAGIRLAVQ